MRRILPSLALLACTTLPLASWTSSAHAQLDPGTITIIQNGKTVGKVFVPIRDANTCTYAEYWFLYSTYVYPSKSNGASVTLSHVNEPYTNLTNFVAVQRKIDAAGKLVTTAVTEESGKCGATQGAEPK